MISVIDRTLTYVTPDGSPDEIRQLMSMMFDAGVNILEISEALYLRLDGDLPDKGKYILRLAHVGEASRFEKVHRFVSTGTTIGNTTISEEYFLRGEDFSPDFVVPPLFRPARVNIQVRDIGEDPEAIFPFLRSVYLGHIEFSPVGNSGIATSLVGEWFLANGGCAVTTVSGVGGYASFEETCRFLNTVRRRRPMISGEKIGVLRAELYRLTGRRDFLVEEAGAPLITPYSSCPIVKFGLDALGCAMSSERLKLFTLELRRLAAERGCGIDRETLYREFQKYNG